MIHKHSATDTRLTPSRHLPKQVIEVLPHKDLPFGWWEPVYHNFKNLATHFGLAVNLDRTYFSGFYHDTAGSSYEAEINVQQLLLHLKAKSWQTVVAAYELSIPELTTDPKVIRQLETGLITAQGHVRALKYKTRIYVVMQFKYPEEMEKNYRAVDGEIETFIDAVIELCEELNQWLFARLLHTYECLIHGEGPLFSEEDQ